MGPDRFKAGLPGDTTPQAAKACLAKYSAQLGADCAVDAALKTCIGIAGLFDYDVKVGVQ